ncbi:MAG: hypothetical protein LBR65_05200 [Culturomica sp.]|jgi:hypothetical protein|nr:hypothetical protein [Culturomica sp.]
MVAYIKLQYLLTNRKLSAFGVHPAIGYPLLLLLFIGLSTYLFNKTTFAPYAYTLIALYFTAKLSEIRRNDFLKICFGRIQYRKIRLLENLIVVLPFAIFLLYKEHYIPPFLLVATTILLALLNVNITYNIPLPTPFYKKPFEFTVGFRNTFFLFIIAYALTAIAVTVNNFNLGIFSLLLIFLTVLCYYLKPENEYFVWAYSATPAQFLIEKIKTAFRFSFYLCLPILLTLSLFYTENTGVLLLFTALGYLYLVAVILAKYAAFPGEIDLMQAIMLSITFIFPPMLIAVIPLFARQSVHELKRLLP